jgi:hypothetical protein
MMPRKKQRRSVAELIAGIEPNSTGRSWFDCLNAEDQQYVRDVVREMVCTPGIALLPVAKSLVTELKLARNPETVVRTLKELMEHVAEAECKRAG